LVQVAAAELTVHPAAEVLTHILMLSQDYLQAEQMYTTLLVQVHLLVPAAIHGLMLVPMLLLVPTLQGFWPKVDNLLPQVVQAVQQVRLV
jgi:hypothetical protein